MALAPQLQLLQEQLAKVRQRTPDQEDLLAELNALGRPLPDDYTPKMVGPASGSCRCCGRPL